MSKEYQFTFGFYAGKSLDEISLKKLDSYLGWMERIEEPTPKMEEAICKVIEYLNDPVIARELERIL